MSSITRRGKRKAQHHHHRLSCPSSSPSSSEDEPPHKKLALSLNRLSLSSTPVPDPDPPDIEMRQRKSYEKDAFTTVIESLSTTSSESEEEDKGLESDAPFPRDEAHVTILSEIETRLTKFPPSKVFTSKTGTVPDNALVLYRSPESMGLPKLERQRQEEMKVEMRRKIMEKRRRLRDTSAVERVGTTVGGELDGYEADAEDLDEVPVTRRHIPNGYSAEAEHMEDEDEDGDEDMMDLD